MFVSSQKPTVNITKFAGQVESKICTCPWWLRDFSNTLAKSSYKYEYYLTLPENKKRLIKKDHYVEVPQIFLNSDSVNILVSLLFLIFLPTNLSFKTK